VYILSVFKVFLTCEDSHGNCERMKCVYMHIRVINYELLYSLSTKCMHLHLYKISLYSYS